MSAPAINGETANILAILHTITSWLYSRTARLDKRYKGFSPGAGPNRKPVAKGSPSYNTN